MLSRFSPSTLVAAVFAVLSALGVLYMISSVQTQVERSVQGNFVAAGILARVQLQGERMRRYEKEMFIYITDTEKRNAYAKEWDVAARDLLVEIDTALLPSGRSFNEDERKEIDNWKLATNFYIGQFEKLVASARRLDEPKGATPLELNTALDFNKAIGPGKDRFRELLKGADAMRAAKEKASLQIAQSIATQFSMLLFSTLALAAIGLLIVVLWPLVGPKPRTNLSAHRLAGADGSLTR